MIARDTDLKITAIQAFPTSFPVKPEDSISLGVWKTIYDKQLASHGMGAGTSLAMSGIGVEVDEDFIAAHPVIEGLSYV